MKIFIQILKTLLMIFLKLIANHCNIFDLVQDTQIDDVYWAGLTDGTHKVRGRQRTDEEKFELVN